MKKWLISQFQSTNNFKRRTVLICIGLPLMACKIVVWIFTNLREFIIEEFSSLPKELKKIWNGTWKY